MLCDLPFQYDWRGNSLVNTRLRVCYDTCYDVAQPNGQRPIVFKPDPAPIPDARPGWIARQIQGTGDWDYIDDVPIIPDAAQWDEFIWDSGIDWS